MLPKVIVPRQISDTTSPVLPNLRRFIACLPSVARQSSLGLTPNKLIGNFSGRRKRRPIRYNAPELERSTREEPGMRVLQAVVFAVLLMGLSLANASGVRADEAEGHHRMALNYERNGDLKAACREAHKSVELRPDYAPAWMTLGSLERKKGKLDQSLT